MVWIIFFTDRSRFIALSVHFLSVLLSIGSPPDWLKKLILPSLTVTVKVVLASFSSSVVGSAIKRLEDDRWYLIYPIESYIRFSVLGVVVIYLTYPATITNEVVTGTQSTVNGKSLDVSASVSSVSLLYWMVGSLTARWNILSNDGAVLCIALGIRGIPFFVTCVEGGYECYYSSI